MTIDLADPSTITEEGESLDELQMILVDDLDKAAFKVGFNNLN